MKKPKKNDGDTLRELGLVDDTLTLENIEKTLEEILVEARSRSIVALEQFHRIFPGEKPVRAVGIDPNGGTGVTRIEEECVELDRMVRLMETFLAGVRDHLAQTRGSKKDEEIN